MLNLLLGVWSMVPSAEDRAALKLGTDDMQMEKSSRFSRAVANKPQMSGAKPAATPFTPRTLAFNTLDRQLPLRSDDASRFA